MFLLLGCDRYDSNFIPYRIKGLDVWVYNDITDREYYGGRVKTNYSKRKSALAECGNRAYAIANQNHLQDWSYICCTVTSSSDCMTKVR